MTKLDIITILFPIIVKPPIVSEINFSVFYLLLLLFYLFYFIFLLSYRFPIFYLVYSRLRKTDSLNFDSGDSLRINYHILH